MSNSPTISAAPRAIDQGNTWTSAVEPAAWQNVVAVDKTLGGKVKSVYEKQFVQQWKGTIHLAKRYRYVGYTSRATAEADAELILAAYTVDLPKYGIGLDAEDGLYKYMQVGTAPTCCATVTPVHTDGQLWEVEVDVDATAEAYYASDSAPTLDTLQSILSSVSDFPEAPSTT